MATTYSRSFTECEQRQRDALVVAWVENDCEGCESIPCVDGEIWRPAQDCPVHGEHCEPWWIELNEQLDRRWPGTWSA